MLTSSPGTLAVCSAHPGPGILYDPTPPLLPIALGDYLLQRIFVYNAASLDPTVKDLDSTDWATAQRLPCLQNHKAFLRQVVFQQLFEKHYIQKCLSLSDTDDTSLSL